MEQKVEEFRTVVWEFYRRYGRHDLPWRQPEAGGTFDPYKILVSEIMLQQTQVGRVIPKYQLFLERFPSFATLAAAPLGEVLRAWSGLGYNRRAKFLWQCAGQVVAERGGQLPLTSAELVKLPGIGPNTAGAVLAYAFNAPALFVETNIRTVFIHHFFADQTGVSDRDILAMLQTTFPTREPGATKNLEGVSRYWYWALMDYGTHLKQTIGNLNTLSKHYAKQSRFEGSTRQLRGQVLRLLSERPYSLSQLQSHIPDPRLSAVLGSLTAEGFIIKTARAYHLT